MLAVVVLSALRDVALVVGRHVGYRIRIEYPVWKRENHRCSRAGGKRRSRRESLIRRSTWRKGGWVDKARDRRASVSGSQIVNHRLDSATGRNVGRPENRVYDKIG